MANVCDYVKWRGDLNIEQSEFNEIDNLILSRFSYFPFDKIIKENEVVTIKELSERFKKQDIRKLPILWKDDVDLFPLMGESERFGKLLATKYINKIDQEQEKQFAAITVLMPNDTIFVSYRGTDNTIVGWKEDLNMSFKSHIASQISAKKYLEIIAQEYPDKKIRIGGHSKGGNLAIYAAAMCYDRLKRRIIAIYNNDGPGFLESMLEKKAYLEIKDKVRTIVPETSIIGMLLEHGDSYEVVKSTGKGIMQHDGLNWQVYRNGFVKLDERSKESLVIDKTISAWVMGLSDDERVAFVDAVYDMLTRAGVNYLSDLEKYKPTTLNSMAKEMFSMEPEKGRMVRRTIRALISEYGKNVVKGMRGIN